jgi:hypothetical protein
MNVKYQHIFEKGDVKSQDKTNKHVITLATEIDRSGPLTMLNVGYSIKQKGDAYSRKQGNEIALKRLTEGTKNFERIGIPDVFASNQSMILLWTLVILTKNNFLSNNGLTVEEMEKFDFYDFSDIKGLSYLNDENWDNQFYVLRMLNNFNYDIMMNYPENNQVQIVYENYVQNVFDC